MKLLSDSEISLPLATISAGNRTTPTPAAHQKLSTLAKLTSEPTTSEINFRSHRLLETYRYT